MMGERTVMQEALFYEFSIERHRRFESAHKAGSGGFNGSATLQDLDRSGDLWGRARATPALRRP